MVETTPIFNRTKIMHITTSVSRIQYIMQNFEIKAFFIKDEVLLTVGCTIFPMYLFIAKYLFTGSFINRSIDI